MLIQRGYKVVYVKSFKPDYEKYHPIIEFVGSNSIEDIYIFFSENKLNKVIIKDYISLICSTNIKHVIILYHSNITSSAKGIINQITDINIELFLFKELRINITKHRLVPLHEKVTDPQILATFNKKYKTKLPILLKSDPIARFYNFTRGDVIKITRYINTPNKYILYRIVR